MDKLIAEHAAKLQKIYNDGTAGDHTFVGVLAEFVIAYEQKKLDDALARIVEERAARAAEVSMCRCGYRPSNSIDRDEHIMTMMLVDDGMHHG